MSCVLFFCMNATGARFVLDRRGMMDTTESKHSEKDFNHPRVNMLNN